MSVAAAQGLDLQDDLGRAPPDLLTPLGRKRRGGRQELEPTTHRDHAADAEASHGLEPSRRARVAARAATSAWPVRAKAVAIVAHKAASSGDQVMARSRRVTAS